MTTFWSDIKYAIRMLRKSPGFTAMAVLTLSLGIGANTAIFSAINSALLRPLPYSHAEQIVDVAETTPEGERSATSGGAFKDWREHSSKFTHLAVYQESPRNLTGFGIPERVNGLQVSAEYLSVLGIAPLVGRDFSTDEVTVGGNDRVIILNHQFWQSRFGADEGILGKSVCLDQIPHTVIGVLPPRTLLFNCGLKDDVQFLVPQAIDAPGQSWAWDRNTSFWYVIGRLKPEVSAIAAEAELRGVKQQLAAEYPSWKDKCSILVTPLQELFVGHNRPMFVLLFGAVALVLLIACVNVSNLLLTRGNTRSREMAIRAALGAHSSRIIRQMLTESVLLALAGCVFGLLFAVFATRLLAHMLLEQLPHVLHPELDANVLLFSIIMACGCGVLFGILPAWRAGKMDINSALKSSERGSASRSKQRSQSFLVMSEFAFTVVLLIGSGLFLHSFIRVLAIDPGFNPKHTLAFDLSFPPVKYPHAEDTLRFTKEVIRRIEALPGVESVGAVSAVPLSGTDMGFLISRTDRPEPSTPYGVGLDGVSGDYFSAIGITLLRGRVITEADNVPTASPVIVIDSCVARDLFPDEDPIGGHLNLRGNSYEIVGIVAPVRQLEIEQVSRPRAYCAQAFWYPPPSIVVRSTVEASTLTQTIRDTILKADPDQPIANVRTLEQEVHKSVAPRLTTLALLGSFAVVAVGLASIGIYGVVSYTISQRAHELSIRSALGAERRDLIRLIFQNGMKLSSIGIVVGLVIAMALSRLLASLLYEVKTYDPLVFLGSVLLLSVVAVLSIYIPACRAAKTNPMEVLRNE